MDPNQERAWERLKDELQGLERPSAVIGLAGANFSVRESMEECQALYEGADPDGLVEFTCLRLGGAPPKLKHTVVRQLVPRSAIVGIGEITDESWREYLLSISQQAIGAPGIPGLVVPEVAP